MAGVPYGVALEAARRERGVRRGLQFVEGEFGQKLLRGRVVVIAAIGPEELGEIDDLVCGRPMPACA